MKVDMGETVPQLTERELSLAWQKGDSTCHPFSQEVLSFLVLVVIPLAFVNVLAIFCVATKRRSYLKHGFVVSLESMTFTSSLSFSCL